MRAVVPRHGGRPARSSDSLPPEEQERNRCGLTALRAHDRSRRLGRAPHVFRKQRRKCCSLDCDPKRKPSAGWECLRPGDARDRLVACRQNEGAGLRDRAAAAKPMPTRAASKSAGSAQTRSSLRSDRPQPDASAERAGDQGGDSGNQRVEVCRRRRSPLAPREMKQRGTELCGPIHGIGGPANQSPEAIRVIQLTIHELKTAEHRRQQIVEIVSDAAGKSAG